MVRDAHPTAWARGTDDTGCVLQMGMMGQGGGLSAVLGPGRVVFFTVVTERRSPILGNDVAQEHLRAAFRDCLDRWPFRLDALVMLPDHLHAIWTLPADDAGDGVGEALHGDSEHRSLSLRPSCLSMA